ncbi:glycosyl hydrolase [Olivibacter domesticus]|uniref:Glycosyl hydrolase catalytic core n=1 Tax=Olivibacter domesticus TaxID=407022 RepID=A0A1H7YWR2_OLID1|nr:glycosyl hydrolase [Olivibacter domesticus]SEM50590.1 Glycosyl hydrolase catalytic core [Olivibacter domesticus]
MKSNYLVGLIFSMLVHLLIFERSSCQEIYTKHNFTWGINGHPFTQHQYRFSTWNDQINLLDDLGMDSYRIDLPLINTGVAKNEKLILDFFKRLKAIHVKPMPVVFPKENMDITDSIGSYKSFFNQGEIFATRYGEFIDVMEIGNEWDVRVMKKGKPVDGTKREHFNLEESKKVMWILAGFIDGVKSVKPSMKISLSVVWTHLYYLELLKHYQIKYDIIGYHWYSNMGNITNVRKPYGDILSKVKYLYNKEIWITEFNTHQGTRKKTFKEQDEYIKETLNQLLKQGIIKGFFIYELFDQAALKGKYPSEVSFGITYLDGGHYEKKPVYNTYKEIIREFKASKIK